MNYSISVIFIPTNSRDCDMVRNLIEYCEANTNSAKINFNIISVEQYNQEGINDYLKKHQISFNDIRIYDSTSAYIILKRETPDIIIVCHDGSVIERSFVLAGNYLGIPTLMVQVGSLASGNQMPLQGLKSSFIKLFLGHKMKRVIQKYQYLFRTICDIKSNTLFAINYFVPMFLNDLKSIDERGKYCKIIAVHTNREKETLVRKGIQEKNIFPVGNPKFDGIFNKEYDDLLVVQALGLDAAKKKVLYLTQSFVEHGLWHKAQRDEVVLSIVKGISSIENIELIVKVHPLENISEYQDLLEKNMLSPKLCYNEIDIYSLIHAADLIVTINSTAALEAVLMHKPLVTLNYIGEPEYLPFTEYGVALGVYDERQLNDVIKYALYDEGVHARLDAARRRFFDEQMQLSDGCASKRLFDLITRIVNQKSDS